MATAAKAKKRTVRTASGLKRARQGIKENARNSSLRSRLRTAIKSVRKAIAGGDKTVAGASLKAAQKVIDSIADKRIVHKNKAARDKSRLSAAVKALA
ncbi:MAG: 30S ribosomal protein S20 [Burkholderiales bacterium]|nr:30S ribosomal protein S20 [Burkholderiales bacterium]